MSAPTIASANLLGHVVEQYKFVELIHTGPHGVIYRAIDMTAPSSSTGRDVGSDRAIKVISKHGPKLGALEIGLHSLVSEHANVITMEDSFEDEDNYFLVLDLCPGGDLFTQIWERDAYRHNDERVRTAFVQLVDAVEACHAVNVYHRDLKPENILCNEDGSEVYICDFGLGRGRPISREFGSGSLNYMSPECLGEDLGCRPYSNVRHDIWALGVVLFNMITSEHPWGKASTEDEQFSDFLHNPEFFLDHFDLSEGANTILRSIFTLNPMGRTTLPELRAAILALGSFFRPDLSPRDEAVEPKDIEDVVFSFSVVDEDGEEVTVDEEEMYIYPSADRFCMPVKPFKQPLELDILAVDAAVRSFFTTTPKITTPETEDYLELPVFSRSSSASSIGSDEDEDDEDDDSDLPITPGALTPLYGVAVAEVNVYEGRFTEALKGSTFLALPKSLDARSTKMSFEAPPAMELSGMESGEWSLDVV